MSSLFQCLWKARSLLFIHTSEKGKKKAAMSRFNASIQWQKKNFIHKTQPQSLHYSCEKSKISLRASFFSLDPRPN